MSNFVWDFVWGLELFFQRQIWMPWKWAISINNMSNFRIWTKFSKNARIFYLALKLTPGGNFYHDHGITKLAILGIILGLTPLKWSPGCNFCPIRNIIAFLKNSDQKQKISYMAWCCSSILRHWNCPLKKNAPKKWMEGTREII